MNLSDLKFAIVSAFNSSMSHTQVRHIGASAVLGIAGSDLASAISTWLQAAILLATLTTILIRIAWDLRKFYRKPKDTDHK